MNICLEICQREQQYHWTCKVVYRRLGLRGKFGESFSELITRVLDESIKQTRTLTKAMTVDTFIVILEIEIRLLAMNPVGRLWLDF